MNNLTQSKRDFLTGCYTKEDLLPFLKSVWDESRIAKKPFSLLVIDVDRFKSFNDKYGHLCGDEVLKYFSSSLRLTLGETENFPFRFGGDEFVVVFPGKTSAEAYPFALKLVKNIKSRHFLLKGKQFKMSFSGGVASYPKDSVNVEDLLERADQAMYFSKRGGHGRSTQFSKIWLKKLQFFLSVGLTILAGIVFVLFSGSLGKVSRLLPPKLRIMAPISAPVSPVAPLREKNLDKVYLRSGGVLKGKIIREDDESLEIKLKLDRGEGMMEVRKSEISNIERAPLSKY